jgi:hypothetical protein
MPIIGWPMTLMTLTERVLFLLQVRFFHAIKQGVHRVFVDHPW